MKILTANFKTTSAAGYPVRIIIKMNQDHIFYIVQRFLISKNTMHEWNDFTLLRVFKDVALIENRLGFQGTIKHWAIWIN
jgi:hypothetical protein